MPFVNASHRLCSISHPPAGGLRNGFPESRWARADARSWSSAAESCVSLRIRICGCVKRSGWNSRGNAPGRRDQRQPLGLASSSDPRVVKSRPHHGRRVPFLGPGPCDSEITFATNPPTLSVMTLANISAPGSHGTQKRKSFCASRSLPSANVAGCR